MLHPAQPSRPRLLTHLQHTHRIAWPSPCPLPPAAILSAVANDWTTVQDTASVLEATGTAVCGLDAFFAVTALLCLILTFFASWLSFAANVRENAREFAILRSLLPAATVARVYVYEALAVTLAGLLAGALVGLAVATTLAAQFNAFVELPFDIAVPWALLGSFAAGVAGVAAAASYEPARPLMRASIAATLKGHA